MNTSNDDDLSQLNKNQIVKQNLKQKLSASPTFFLETMLQKKTEYPGFEQMQEGRTSTYSLIVKHLFLSRVLLFFKKRSSYTILLANNY